jgi:hypothetical protein
MGMEERINRCFMWQSESMCIYCIKVIFSSINSSLCRSIFMFSFCQSVRVFRAVRTHEGASIVVFFAQYHDAFVRYLTNDAFGYACR